MMRRRRRVAVIGLLALTVSLVTIDLVRGDPDEGSARQLVGAPASGGEPVLAPPALSLPQQPDRRQPDSKQRDPKLPAPKVVPRSGRGTFAVAPGASSTIGSGKLMRYRVETEDGSGESPAAFASAVDTTLAAPNGWTTAGNWAFRRVSTGPVDFIVRLATPATVDRVCSAAGLDTQGYVSCRTGEFVMINLARWELAVPDYKGDVALYRNYVVNHEVGHRLGRGHELCPGPGRLAPIMQQQTYGLNGCRANGWPYSNARLITGPPSAAD